MEIQLRAGVVQAVEREREGGSFETSAITRWEPPRGANFIEIDYRSCLLLRFLVPFRRSHVAHRGDDQSASSFLSLRVYYLYN